MDFATINNLNSLISDFGSLDMKEFVAASAQTQLELNDQLGQLFGRQHEDRLIQGEPM